MFTIDKSITKKEKTSNDKIVTLVRCSCTLCDKCWVAIGHDRCVCGGPFSGYVKV